MKLKWGSGKISVEVEYNVKDMLWFFNRAYPVKMLWKDETVHVGCLEYVTLEKLTLRPKIELRVIQVQPSWNELPRSVLLAKLGWLKFSSSVEAKMFLNWYKCNAEEFWRQFLSGFYNEFLKDACKVAALLNDFKIDRWECE